MANDVSICSTNAHTRDTAVANTATAGRAPDPGDTVRLLAQQFESLLLGQMLRDMQPNSSGEDGVGFGGALTETIYSELAGVLTKAGGIGLTDTIVAEMIKMQEQAQ